MTLPPFDAPACVAIQTWRLCLPCVFGQRATWDNPTQALGWLGRDHCWSCMAYLGEPRKVKGKR